MKQKVEGFLKRVNKKSGALLLLAIFMFAAMHHLPAYAAQCGGANTAILECADDEGGVWHVMMLVLDILTVGVGILGIVGISVAGVQIVTAGDNANQVKKAKSRLFQIIIGLGAYIVLFAFVQWIAPGGALNDARLQSMGSTSEIEATRQRQEEARLAEEARRQAEEAERNANSGSSSSGSSSGSSSSSSSSSSNSSSGTAEDIGSTALQIGYGKLSYDDVAKDTGYYDYMKDKCRSIGGGCCDGGERGYRTFCSGFVYNVMHYTGADPDYPMKLTGKQMDYLEKSSKWKNVTSEVGGKTSKLKPGDVLIRSGHTLLIAETSKGELRTVQASVCDGSTGGFEPSVRKIISEDRLDNSAGSLSKYQVYRLAS